MPRDSSGYSGRYWKTFDRLTNLGLQIGGATFIVLSAYLLWGINSGDFAHLGGLKGHALADALARIQLVCKFLIAGGVVVFISAAYQLSGEEIAGYLFIIAGAGMRWGVPYLAGMSPGKVSLAKDSIPAFIVAQYMLLGTIALVFAAPLVLIDVWERLRGTRRWIQESTEAAKRELPKRGLDFFCWQTPNCRQNVKEVCPAYLRKKSCWQLKSGCHCEEEKLLRLAHRLPPVVQKAASGPTIIRTSLNAAELRRRCRECFMFREHQELKYKLLSPLVFPICFAIMYYGYQTIRHYLHAALEMADEFSKHISFMPTTHTGPGPEWMNVPAASNSVEWVFVVLLGLILVTYMLKFLEYLVFDLQI